MKYEGREVRLKKSEEIIGVLADLANHNATILDAYFRIEEILIGERK